MSEPGLTPVPSEALGTGLLRGRTVQGWHMVRGGLDAVDGGPAVLFVEDTGSGEWALLSASFRDGDAVDPTQVTQLRMPGNDVRSWVREICGTWWPSLPAMLHALVKADLPGIVVEGAMETLRVVDRDVFDVEMLMLAVGSPELLRRWQGERDRMAEGMTQAEAELLGKYDPQALRKLWGQWRERIEPMLEGKSAAFLAEFHGIVGDA